MSAAGREDVVRLFPGIQDHGVVELLAMKASIGELESAALLLAGIDADLADAKRNASVRLSRILHVLTNAELVPESDRD